ncbi:SGNH/GDSL hydrolase family protein [Brevibacillus sp. SYSU BS000544]|uniref:SGNH/GDSL hydrolase family protein n=1 Tax=Brevibacillus sp. SYSU BS000544 TaxID=3416443 RepID=UPI003CE4BC54
MNLRKGFYHSTKIIVSLTLIWALVFATSVFAKQEQREEVDYLALGNSLAAGVTPYNELGKGYTDFLAERIERIGYLAHWDKRYAVPGYTTTNVLDDIKNDVKKDTDSSKDEKGIRENIRDAEIITLDAGANDLLKQIKILPDGTVNADPAVVQQVLTQIGSNLTFISREIHELNDDVSLYIMGYYNPYSYLPEEQQKQLKPILDLLNKTIQKVAKNEKATFVPTADAIAEDFEKYLPNPLNIHLSEEGYEVVADLFWNYVIKEFKAEKLLISKKSVTLKEGAKTQLKLTAVYKNGARENVTAFAKWTTTKSKVARVKAGLIEAKDKGEATIKALFDGELIKIPVTVK